MSGSNLPPGCTNADIERAFGGGREPTPVEEELIDLLERHQVPQKILDEALDVLDRWLVAETADPPVEPEEEEWDDDIPF